MARLPRAPTKLAPPSQRPPSKKAKDARGRARKVAVAKVKAGRY